ncbi:hypothetical protein [Qipengyuania spongiae]|uniref:GNAT family N-acetyltransferase n=1 Tax=Qipengyuania spongiae TaxID=2909673 RepID=A0ABY5SYC4_9SPHN|nr:hypothetical protein [Qipengyuania spongiae]UVI39239.1 hypothetical protein L1F33_13565 [Qipengyuania spongiae]
MSNILTHTAPIVRAIHVERVCPDADRWRASYSGDEWTDQMTFEPAMPLSQLRYELLSSPQRCGLPIVFFTDAIRERAA